MQEILLKQEAADQIQAVVLSNKQYLEHRETKIKDESSR